MEIIKIQYRTNWQKLQDNYTWKMIEVQSSELDRVLNELKHNKWDHKIIVS
jgi:hypothetical protein